MSEIDTKGWTLGSRPNASGEYAIIDRLYACMRFAYWNQRDARWSWDGQFRPETAVWYYRRAPGLPSDVAARWGVTPEDSVG